MIDALKTIYYCPFCFSSSLADSVHICFESVRAADHIKQEKVEKAVDDAWERFKP